MNFHPHSLPGRLASHRTMELEARASDRFNSCGTECRQLSMRRSLMIDVTRTMLDPQADQATLGRMVFEKIGPELRSDVLFIHRLDQESTLQLIASEGIPLHQWSKVQVLSLGQSYSGAIASSRVSILADHQRLSEDPLGSELREMGLRAFAGYPLIGRDGSVLGTFAIASTTSDQYSSAECEFLQSISHFLSLAWDRLHFVNRLREADQRKDEFLATLAHELRNPLAPIRNGLQILRLAGDDQATIARTQSIMERQIDQMARLIEDLMDLSRISRGKIELKSQPVFISEFLQIAVETSRPLIEQRSHHLTLKLAQEPIMVLADDTRMAQVFANLLNNAAKYTESGGQIHLIVRPHPDTVEVTISDNGMGIAPFMLPRVFDMFSQVDRSLEKSHSGLGIGLNIVKRLVEMHGGTIFVTSPGQGQGSTFTVRLPRFHGDRTTHIPSLPNHQPSNLVRRRVLVVDDNPDGVSSLAGMLQMMGHEIIVAHDGLEAIDQTSRWNPELILMDIGMPRLNGFEACRRMRKLPGGSEILIAAMTGWGQEEDRRQSREAGFDYHLVKPVELQAISELLLSLNRRPARYGPP